MKKRVFFMLLTCALTLSLMPTARAADSPPASYTSSTGIKLAVREIPYSGIGDGVYQDLSGMVGSSETLTDAEGNVLCILDGETIDRTGGFMFGLAPAEIFDPNTGEEGYGYINKYGEVVVEPKYEYVSGFTESGLARVQNTGYKYGYIDSTGREVIPCQYNAASSFSGGYAIVREWPDNFTQALKVIDTTGKTVWESPTVTTSDGFNTYVTPIYDFNGWQSQEFVDGEIPLTSRDPDTGAYYPVLLDVATGQIREVPALSYEDSDREPTYLGRDRFRYVKNDHAAILDLEGNVIIPYGSIFNDYCFWGFVETDAGIADLDGNLVIPVGSGENAWQSVTLLEDGRMTGQWPGVYKLFEIALDDGSAPADPEPQPNVPSSWAAEQVNAAIAAGIVPESLQSKYTQAATRAEFCALAVELYETVTGTEIAERAAFSDTTDVNVQKMAGLGVVSGVGNGAFDPSGTLTREQAAAILTRLAEVMGRPLAQSSPTFSDNAAISSWAAGAVGQVQAAGIMSGTGSNNFTPQGSYTREQSILTLLRLYQMAK